MLLAESEGGFVRGGERSLRGCVVLIRLATLQLSKKKFYIFLRVLVALRAYLEGVGLVRVKTAEVAAGDERHHGAAQSKKGFILLFWRRQ